MRIPPDVVTTVIMGAVLTFISPDRQISRQPKAADVRLPPVVSAVEAPAGTEKLDVGWMKVTAPALGVMLAAVATPPGHGPFPVLVLLHGTHGFAPEYVQLAQTLARGGLLAIAPCWFSGGGGEGTAFVSAPIACPEAPALTAPGSSVAVQTVDALVRAVRSLPEARSDRVGLFGHSRGSGAALSYIMGASDPSVRAVALDSGGYPTEWADRADQVKAPILILHGVSDPARDGGSPVQTVQMARNFEAALKRAGKPVVAKYYEQGGHNSLFTDPTQRDDEVQRMVMFFTNHLRN